MLVVVIEVAHGTMQRCGYTGSTRTSDDGSLMVGRPYVVDHVFVVMVYLPKGEALTDSIIECVEAFRAVMRAAGRPYLTC